MDDWVATLPREKSQLYQLVVRRWECSYAMMSVALDEAFSLRSSGELVCARQQVSIAAGLLGRLTPSLIALCETLAARGQMVVQAQVHNTGGQAVDVTGDLKLTGGPDGLSAGPYQEPGITLAPGQSEPIRVFLDKQLPDGPWRALIDLTSGITQRSAEATIDFPPAGSANRGYLVKAVILVLVLLILLSGSAAWIIRRKIRNRRFSSATGRHHLMPAQPGR